MEWGTAAVCEAVVATDEGENVGSVVPLEQMPLAMVQWQFPKGDVESRFDVKYASYPLADAIGRERMWIRQIGG